MAQREFDTVKKGLIGLTLLTAAAALIPLPDSKRNALNLSSNQSIEPPKTRSLCFYDRKPHFIYQEPNAKTGALTIEFDGDMFQGKNGRLKLTPDLPRLSENNYPHVDVPQFESSKLGIYLEAFYNKLIMPMLSIRLMLGRTDHDNPTDIFETDIFLLQKEQSRLALIACWNNYGNISLFFRY